MRRYDVRAKRKHIEEPWSEWTKVDNYNRALHHAAHVEELGYSSKIEVNCEVQALWNILGNGSTEKTDEILDAGFRLAPVLATEIFTMIHNRIALLILKTEMELQVHSEKKRKKKIACLNQELATLQNIQVVLSGLERKYTVTEETDAGATDNEK